MRDKTLKNVVTWIAFILLVAPGARAQAQLSGPTLDEPFHMPTLTDTSTLDVVVVEPWHVDTINGTTRQKLINIHVDDWWPGVEIRVPVRLIVPLQGTVAGFVITGSALEGTGEGDKSISAGPQVALDGGVGVVMTKIKSLGSYPELSSLPTRTALRNRFLQEDLDWRYTEFYFWGAIMMRAITAAFDDDLVPARPGHCLRRLQERHHPAGFIYSRRAHRRGTEHPSHSRPARRFGPTTRSPLPRLRQPTVTMTPPPLQACHRAISRGLIMTKATAPTPACWTWR